MRRMQAAGIDVFGGEVRVLDLAAPASPAPDEVVISVRAAGVGNWDEFTPWSAACAEGHERSVTRPAPRATDMRPITEDAAYPDGLPRPQDP